MTVRISSTHRTVIIRRSFAQQIVDHLKGQENEDKKYHHFVKKSNFKLLDLPYPLLESEMRQYLSQAGEGGKVISGWLQM